MSDFEARMLDYQQRVEEVLQQRLPSCEASRSDLHEAMRYACLNGGKRVRAMLVYASGEMMGVELDALDTSACVMEMIHAYSLIHDDLPAMDDDELRRGRPTCHIAFDEATAILAGDALQALAFEILAHDESLPVSPVQHLAMLRVLADAAGINGMAGGQALDLAATGKSLDLVDLENIHRLKTGALIRAAVALGAMTAPHISKQDLEALDNYARAVGLAFQIMDDVLDETGDTKTLGKNAGADLDLNKSTFTALLGVNGARQAANLQVENALASLASMRHNTWFLEELARFVISRSH